MKKNQIFALAAAAVFLVAVSAGAAVFLTKESYENDKPAKVASKTVKKKNNDITWDQANRSAAQAQPTQVVAQNTCNDGNVAGKVVGGVGGGVLGSMVGKGKGKTAATIGGTLGGAYLGGQAIPLHNATCR